MAKTQSRNINRLITAKSKSIIRTNPAFYNKSRIPRSAVRVSYAQSQQEFRKCTPRFPRTEMGITELYFRNSKSTLESGNPKSKTGILELWNPRIPKAQSDFLKHRTELRARKWNSERVMEEKLEFHQSNEKFWNCGYNSGVLEKVWKGSENSGSEMRFHSLLNFSDISRYVKRIPEQAGCRVSSRKARGIPGVT